MLRSDDSQEAQWVKGYYTGMQAKHVRSLAAEAIGYKILSEPSDKSVVVAFRKAVDGPLPDHLEVIRDPYQVKKLNEWSGA